MTPEQRKAQRETLRALSQISFNRWFTDCMLDYAMIIAAIVAATQANSIAVTALAIVIVGTRQSAIYSLAHDGIHKRISKDPKLNDLLCHYLCCLPLGTTLTATRKGHLDHHAFLKAADDPEKPLFATFLFKVPASRLRVTVLFIACMCAIGAFYTLWGIRRFTHPNFEVLWRTTVFNLLIIAVGVLTGQYMALFVWYVSLVTSFAAFSYLRDWTEHTGVDIAHRFNPSWLFRVIALPHNIWLHYEHHKFPLIPYFNLIEARDKVLTGEDEAPVTSMSHVFGHISQLKVNHYD